MCTLLSFGERRRGEIDQFIFSQALDQRREGERRRRRRTRSRRRREEIDYLQFRRCLPYTKECMRTGERERVYAGIYVLYRARRK